MSSIPLDRSVYRNHGLWQCVCVSGCLCVVVTCCPTCDEGVIYSLNVSKRALSKSMSLTMGELWVADGMLHAILLYISSYNRIWFQFFEGMRWKWSWTLCKHLSSFTTQYVGPKFNPWKKTPEWATKKTIETNRHKGFHFFRWIHIFRIRFILTWSYFDNVIELFIFGL